MELLLIDQDKCKRDGFCAQECPAAIIRLRKDTCPEIIEGGDAACIRCGHCVSVCAFSSVKTI